MDVNKKRGPYTQDMKILFIAVVMVVLLFVVVDLPAGAPDWWESHHKAQTNETTSTILQYDTTEFTIMEETLVTTSGTTNEGSSTPTDFSTEINTIVQMKVVLTWSDSGNGRDADQLAISIQFQGNEIDSDSDESGRIERIINSPNPGNYTAVVTAVSCPGPSGVGSIVDGEEDWNLEITITYEVPAEAA